MGGGVSNNDTVVKRSLFDSRGGISAAGREPRPKGDVADWRESAAVRFCCGAGHVLRSITNGALAAAPNRNNDQGPSKKKLLILSVKLFDHERISERQSVLAEVVYGGLGLAWRLLDQVFEPQDGFMVGGDEVGAADAG